MKTYRKRFLRSAIGLVLLGATLSMSCYTVANARGGVYGYVLVPVAPVAVVAVPPPENHCFFGLFD
jgi:hypothetical protein